MAWVVDWDWFLDWLIDWLIYLTYGCTSQVIERSLSRPLNYFYAFVKNKLDIFVWVYFWALNSVPLLNLSILLSISCCLVYHSFIVSLKSGSVSPRNLLFQYRVGYSESFTSPLKLWNNFFQHLQINLLGFWSWWCWIL